MNHLFLFLLGLGVGSFINVLTMRYDEDGPVFGKHIVFGRSHCPRCKKILSWYELIPVISFLLQFGRCRNCGAKLSLQYPIVELITGFIFISVPYYFFVYHKSFYLAQDLFFLNIYSALWVAVFCCLLAIGIIDFRKYIVPDGLVVATAILGILWIAISYYSDNFGVIKGSFVGSYADLFGIRDNILQNHLAGGILGLFLIGAIFFGTRGAAIGFGDVKLFGALGILFGYPDILMIFFFSFFIGAVVSLPLLVRKLKGMKDFVPFAPFIITASFIVYYFGNDIMRLYFELFKIY